ncbi:AI-2 transport protein TqsA [Roseovarius gaetbuli]|uniref:AI-2 transport protein TqsA n=1 Tax=Roseovarius gaetbuli TaxID=1356575 RepID=A0A1X7A421_9RHOB|nr:AI-2E family transporter [Roseovarius gaetbuli]SLN70076.1 AI-2 transport protein TqsA [Roseovarius gaetbuli]
MSNPPAPRTEGPTSRACYHWPSVGIFILLLGSVIVASRSFLMPVVLAFLLSLTFSPIRRGMSRLGIAPFVTAVTVIVFIIGLTGAAIMGLSQPVQSYAKNAPQIMRDVEWKLRGLNSAMDNMAKASDEVEKLADGGTSTTRSDPERVIVDKPSLLQNAVANTPVIIAQLVMTLALLFFMIASGDMFYEKIIQASPTFSDKRRALKIMFQIERKISRYFLTITLINACLGIAIGLVLYLAGMPNPAVFGVMAFVLNYIPFLGAVSGAAVTFAIGIVSLDTVGEAGLMASIYLGMNAVEGQLITPYAVGRSLRLNPVVVFLMVAFWGWAWSVIGMVIAVPMLITLRAFSEYVPTLRNLRIFLSDRATPAEDSLARTEKTSGTM